ncbi:MAG TPA: nuclear transport factor 2 family protein [Candidatus Angelobacter sp.]|nr:nuclear transport factor 2 family protein [Candidatus Angelobacter sp.]
MKPFLKFVLVVVMVCAGKTAAHETGVVPDGEDKRVALQADRALVEAIDKGDQEKVGSLLDVDFSWTDRTGKTRTKAELLGLLGALAGDPDTDVKSANYGEVMLLRGSHRIATQNARVRFVRVWVKRPKGWQLLIYQETTMAETTPATRSGFGSPSGGAPVDCDNPCKTVPYKPQEAAEREVVAMWQAVERTVLTNDVEAWIPNFTDDFVFVTPDGGPPLNKADRVTMIKELKSTNTTLIPAKVESMRVWVFGDAAVMRSEHKPMHGKTLHITRVFVKSDGHWQITFGQQTAIE